jgi:hypothetical protein
MVIGLYFKVAYNLNEEGRSMFTTSFGRCVAFVVLAAVLAVFSVSAQAGEWMRGVEVRQLGTYQHATHHFVWFSTAPPTSQCTHVIRFDDAVGGGKGLMAVLMAALVNKRPVDVQIEGCAIVEVYLR